MFSGTTCVTVFFDKEKIVCANSGDSRGILISNSDKGYRYTPLSRDHKPDMPDEANRVLKRNGRIEPSKVTPEFLYGPNFRSLGRQAMGLQFYGPNRVWLKNK